MVRAIITWSLHNRLIVILGVLALIGGGSYSAAHLNVEAYPDPTPPLVEVIAQNPGASPEEMERLVSRPLEIALNGMSGLEALRSTSIAGLSDIKCQFAYGTDYHDARQEVINRIARADLPAGVMPALSPWSPTGEIVRYVLEGPGFTTNQIKAVQDWVLNPLLKQVPGVIDVTGYGGTVKQYQVLLDTRLLKQYGVTMDQVEDAIARSNANVGGDVLTLGVQSHNVRAVGLLGGGKDPLDPANVSKAAAIETEKLDDIRDVVITTAPDGTPIFVRQVAQVIVGHKPRQGIVGRGEDDDVVEGIVLMRKYEKSLPTAEAVAAKMVEIERENLLPRGMKIFVFNQRTDLVHVTTENVLHNLVVGITLVIAVLFIFLGDLASAGIVAIVIPLALLYAIMVLYLQGQSGNLLSIGAVDFGIIVDSSVIIVETIYRRITEHGADRSRPLIDRIAEASNEVERPLFFSTLIIVCAFLPLFTMSGPAGALFGPMAATYAFSIFGALMLSVTLAPVLCSFFFHNKTEEKEPLIDRVMKWVYGRVLHQVLRFRLATLLLMCILLVFTFALLPGLGGEFMPELEEGNLWIRALMPRTVSREESARMAPRLREVIASVPEVRGVMSQVGRPDDGTDITSFFNLEFNVPLRPMNEWREGMTRQKIEEELAAKFADFEGVSFNFSQLIRDNIDEALSGIKGANSVKLIGSDLDTLEATGQRVVSILQTVPGIENVGVFHIIGQPNLEIEIDRRACARYGVNVADVEEVIQVAIGGRAFSQMVEGEKRYDIVLRLPKDLRDDPNDIARIPVDIKGGAGKPGARIPLSHLAKVVPHKSGASYIYRENNRRFLPIKFNVKGRDLASTIAEARRKVEDRRTGAMLPPSYHIEWSGEFAQMQAANKRLAVMVPLSVVLILVLLYTMFQSVKDALLVMAGVLPAAMGGVWALRLTETNFSISAAVGFISIFGVAVQNGVLLISYFNQMRASGATVREAVTQGAELRLRPVAMTSLTAILGLLPAALAVSIGSQASKPLAIVVVGGISTALLLALYLIPALYSYFPAPRGPHRAGRLPGETHDLDSSSTHPPTQAEVDFAAPPRSGITWKRLLTIAIVLAIAAALGQLARRYPREAQRVWEFVAGKRRSKEPHSLAERPARIGQSWDGLITLSRKKQTVMGMETVKAVRQTDPIRLELLGTTEYITETLTKIRPMFKGRVDKVYVSVNQAVKKGEPLIDMYSKDLADAKSAEYEIERIQWVYDKNLLETREPLVKSKAISQQLFEETKNNEMKSRREYEVARDKLFVYGLSNAEVEAVETEAGSQKAHMTFRSPTDGYVIERDVVPGNLYDDDDTLLVIAPLDRLWVWGNVFESDLDLVRLGQPWEIRFPFLEQKLQGKVEYISNRVDPSSHAVHVRTSIPNPDGRLKSDMLVRGMLEIPPTAGRTVIPRTALLVDDGRCHLFVRVAGKPDTFERRVVAVAQEKDDHAVIESGLKEGEEVVSVGGLMLAQIYENAKTGQTGAPPASEVHE